MDAKGTPIFYSNPKNYFDHKNNSNKEQVKEEAKGNQSANETNFNSAQWVPKNAFIKASNGWAWTPKKVLHATHLISQ